MKNKLAPTVIGVIAVVLAVCTFARLFPNPNWLEPSPVFSTTYDSATPIPFPVSKPKTMTKLPGRIHSFTVSPDMKAMAIATSEGVVVYDLVTHEQLQILREGENAFSTAFSPDGQKLAVGSLIMQNREAGMPHLVVSDTSTWEILFEPRLGNGDTTMFFGALAWSPNGKFLATSDYGRGLVTFDIQTGNIISTQKDFLMSPHDIAWSPNGSRIVASGDLGYGFRRWRIDTDEAVRLSEPRVAAFATQLAWSPDGSQLATGGGVIRIWDTSTGNPLRSLGLIDGSIYSQLEWLANGILISLETGYAEREFTIIRFWNMDTGEIMMEFHGARGIYGE